VVHWNERPAVCATQYSGCVRVERDSEDRFRSNGFRVLLGRSIWRVGARKNFEERGRGKSCAAAPAPAGNLFWWIWHALDKDSPLRQVVDVMITNKTDRRLEDCRLQLAIITHDGIERPAWARFPFCEPFSLLVDESKIRRVVEYNFDELSPNLLVPLFDEIDNKWVRREGGLLLTPGEYELCIEGFSSHTPMAHFTLRAKCENERWAIGPDVVSLNSAGDSDTSKPSPLMPAGRAPNLHQRLVRLAKNALYYVKPGN